MRRLRSCSAEDAICLHIAVSSAEPASSMILSRVTEPECTWQNDLERRITGVEALTSTQVQVAGPAPWLDNSITPSK